MIDTFSLEELFNEKFPTPDDPFKQVVRVQEFESAFEFLAKEYKNRRLKLISKIRSEKLTSSLYRVLPRIERHVNCELLKTKYPELYERLVYIKSFDARKILGDKLLYEICLETDSERTRGFSHVRMPDLIANLGESSAEEFFIPSENLGMMRVVPWEI